MPPLSWSAPEFHHQKKGPDWYWALGIIALSSAVAAIIFGNMLFGALIIIAAFVLALYAAKRPRIVQFEISERGIAVGRLLYPYQNLQSFWVADTPPESKLLVESNRPYAPLLVIPLANIEPETVRAFLQNKLNEVEHEEPIAVRLFERLGF